MRKLKNVIVMLSVTVLFLTGCSSSVNEVACIEAYHVYSAYDNFRDMYRDTWIDWTIAPVDLGPSGTGRLEETRQIYYSIEDVKKATELVCTKEFAEKTLYNMLDGVFYEEDGDLYRVASEVMWPYPVGDVIGYKVMESSGDFLKVNLVFYSEMDGEGEIDLELVKENGNWIVNDIVDK